MRKVMCLLLTFLVLFPVFSLNASNNTQIELMGHTISIAAETAASEIISYLEEQTGIKLDLLAITSGTADLKAEIFGDIMQTDSTSSQNYLYTIPFFTDSWVSLYRKNESTIMPQNSSRVYACYRKNDIMLDYITEGGYSITVCNVSSLEDAMMKILSGEVDFTLIPSRIAEVLMKDHFLNSCFMYSRALYPVEYRIALPVDNVKAYTELNDMLFTLETTGELQNIYSRHKIVTDKDARQNYNLLMAMIQSIALLLVFLLCIFYRIMLAKRYRKDSVKQHQHAVRMEEAMNRNMAVLEDEAEQLQQKMTDQNNIDPYTGYGNTDMLMQKLEEYTILYSKTGKTTSIAVIDIKRRQSFSMSAINGMTAEYSDILKWTDDAGLFHDGFGVLFILFPGRKAAEIRNLMEDSRLTIEPDMILELHGQSLADIKETLGL